MAKLGQRKDLTNQRFGQLVVLEFAYATDKNAYWKCRCDCGKETTLRGYSLTSGSTKSCGCLARKLVAERSTRHGMYGTRIYKMYRGMKERCLNSNNRAFHRYGGRGIKICQEWLDDFMAFYNWAINNGYSDKLTLDRIDVNGNYCPENCRFTDMKTQQGNKRNNIYVDYKGERICLGAAARLCGISRKTLYWRYKKGERGEMLFRPVKKYNYEKKK